MAARSLYGEVFLLRTPSISEWQKSIKRLMWLSILKYKYLEAENVLSTRTIGPNHSQEKHFAEHHVLVYFQPCILDLSFHEPDAIFLDYYQPHTVIFETHNSMLINLTVNIRITVFSNRVVANEVHTPHRGTIWFLCGTSLELLLIQLISIYFFPFWKSND